MGFFSGIRRRIKKLIPKEVRPAIPFIAAAALPGIPGINSAIANQFTKAALAKMATDDEADLKDALRTGALAAAPAAISRGVTSAAGGSMGEGIANFLNKSRAVEGGTSTIARGIESALNPESFMGQAKLIGSQAATDFGIKQAELNEKAIEEYERDLLQRGIRDKAKRRSAIFDIFVGAGYDPDETNAMLDKYGYADGGKVRTMTKASMSGAMDKYFELLEKAKKKKRKPKADGGRVGLFMGGDADKIDPRAANFVAQTIKGLREANPEMSYEEAKNQALSLARKEFRDESEDFDASEFSSNLQAGVEGLEAAFGQPLGGRRPEPMRIVPGFAVGGDVDDEVLETEEEIITPDYLMKEEGVEIGPQVSSPNAMDELNQLSLEMFGRPVFELSEDEFEMLKDFASQQALKPGLIDEYRNYKYQMEEQGITPMSPRDYFRSEFGAARLGVAKGGPIEVQKPDMEKDTKGKTAAPDYYIKRMEDLMDLGYDYETAGRIAMDYDEYRSAMDKGPIDDYKEGGVIKKKTIKIIGVGKAKDYPGIKKLIEMNKKGKKRFSKADGGKVDKKKKKKYKRDGMEFDEPLGPKGTFDLRNPPKRYEVAEGGLMNLAGNELDLRGGGFVPMGKKERADDVPARLSKNEFVFTADAVRAAGGGSVQKGADLMYDTMKKLEAQS